MPEPIPNDPTLGQTVSPLDPRRARPAEAWCGEIITAGQALGFHRLGFTGAEPFADREAVFKRWLEAGNHGELSYMAQDRGDPRRLLKSVKSMIVVALAHSAPAPLDPLRPSVAAYAAGDDYHQVMKHKLLLLAQQCADISGRTLTVRACVDTAPLLEREAAARAGLSFTGKSTLSIVPGVGSYVLLGELLLDVDLPYAPGTLQGCGSCTRCLDACPTQAFVGEYVLDARRCISYLTIEYRGVIPRDLRPLMGSHVFGCDICQRVCPYNDSKKRPAPAGELSPRESIRAVSLTDLLLLRSSAHRRLVKGTALARTSRPCLQRNAAVAIGNSGDRAFLAPLTRSLESQTSPLVKCHVAWALGRLGGDAARAALGRALEREEDAEVRLELQLALDSFTAETP